MNKVLISRHFTALDTSCFPTCLGSVPPPVPVPYGNLTINHVGKYGRPLQSGDRALLDLLDLTIAQQLLETLEQDDLDDVTISLQRFFRMCM